MRRLEKARINNFIYVHGWIFPDGTFYGCEGSESTRLMEDHVGLIEADAEKKGYTKVMSRAPYFINMNRYTENQLITINRFCQHHGDPNLISWVRREIPQI